MGIKPHEFRAMSMFQWNAVVDAHIEMNGDGTPEAPSAAEFEAAISRGFNGNR